MTGLHLKPIHPFPARMAPAIALDALPASGRPLRVLDPMSGSGTTLVAARLRGHESLGFDTDPLAILISEAWCSDFNPDDLITRSESALNAAKEMYKTLRVGDAYPIGVDDETRAFVRYWFDPKSRRQLTALARSINFEPSTNLRRLLWVAFSRLIITKAHGASLAMDVSHSRPHRVYDRAPALPFDHFLIQIRRVASANPFAGPKRSPHPRARITRADGRRLPLDSGTVDLVITSPPYLNAIDYLRGHKLSLVWMGYTVEELRRIRTNNIGTEVSRLPSFDTVPVNHVAARMCTVDSLSARHTGMLARYIVDLDALIAEIARVLRPNGDAIFVIGNSTIRGTFVKNSAAVQELALRHGMRIQEIRKRPLPDHRRYLPPPSSAGANSLQVRMREEVILHVRRYDGV